MGAFYDRTCWNQRERELKVEKKGALEVWSSSLGYKNVHSVRISSQAMHLKLYQRKRCRFPQRERERKERDLLSQWKLTVNLVWDESWRKEKRWRMICPLKREGGERGRATCPNFPPPSVPSKLQSDQDPLLFLSLSHSLRISLSLLFTETGEISKSYFLFFPRPPSTCWWFKKQPMKHACRPRSPSSLVRNLFSISPLPFPFSFFHLQCIELETSRKGKRAFFL